ncbi:MAG: plastocyanin/azurin family copper-binding protein [Candidatus Micrarchaeota archaeon]
MNRIFSLLVFGILLLGCAQQETGNWEQETGNGQPATGNGEQETGTGGQVVGVGETTGTGNGEQGTGNGGQETARGGTGGAVVGIEQPTPGEGDVTVYIRNFEFVPAEVTVRQGNAVFWVNEDGVPHTVRMIGVIDSPYIAKGGGPYWHTFTEDPGTYEYSCAPHPYMHGTVIVVR